MAISVQKLLHDAGCNCGRPLLGYKPNKGPRCRLCNTEAWLPEDVEVYDEENIEVYPKGKI